MFLKIKKHKRVHIEYYMLDVYTHTTYQSIECLRQIELSPHMTDSNRDKEFV